MKVSIAVSDPNSRFDKWNPLYVAFANSNGNNPQQQFDSGESMAQFTSWAGRALEAYRKPRSIPDHVRLSKEQQAELLALIESGEICGKVPQPQPF